jgi:2-C-methyl-D-erythritol 4-phosphate cytidylyltransferase
VKIHDAVVPLVPLSDTPKECDASLWDRPWTGTREVFIKEHLIRSYIGVAQTPQGFAFPALLRAYKEVAPPYYEDFTDDAEVWATISINKTVAVLPGSEENRKITYPQDFTRSCSPGA